MFKRNKSKLNPPAPPTLDEIFEDLQTFKLDKSTTAQQIVRTKSTESDDNIDEWWKLFRTFQYDVTELEALQTKLIAVKKELDTENTELREKMNLILSEINEAITKVTKELPNQYDQ